MLPPVIKTITVPCPPKHAFDTFTKDIDTWWPKEKNSVSAMNGAVAQRVVMEPKTGGAIVETDHTGTDLVWGSVTEFSPHTKLALAWHINLEPKDATFVEVTFEPSSTGTTVTLKHYGWEAFGDKAQDMHDGYNAGWVGVFETAFANACS
ncbi:hypothetical protein BFP76_06440 [Amylibacter kogurei]|uniref:Activator of Hsp90 ATPase homologue 1/2-like C-terminal domain-containing protein n=1 Tax=Paramylibacter kogurei TaxID=1889778 RepID=A0A2G5K5I5_9RHOB|nr:SRPBCC family protein [Amylibacter kogurei]PIB24807.1 hypothetical protein BFP76_06440 [Amylibacter kogurei]